MIRALILLLLLPALADAAPRASEAHRSTLTREARAVFGLDAPVPLFAGQIHQESAWRDDARSPVGAEGLAQFMPATSQWMTELYPSALGSTPQPWNPRWAMRAMVRYDKWLLKRVVGATECDKWWAALRSYNGGLGHWKAESRYASNPESRVCVDAQCGKAKRASLHCRENLHYPMRIFRHQSEYYLAWGREILCGPQR